MNDLEYTRHILCGFPHLHYLFQPVRMDMEKDKKT